MLQISIRIRMRMDSYEIKIYCCRKAVIMLNYLPDLVSPSLAAAAAVQLGTCGGSWAGAAAAPAAPLLGSESVMCRSGNWYWLLSHPSSPQSTASSQSRDLNPSIHIYGKQKAKVLCHFLVVDSCFSHNFIGRQPSDISGYWSLPKKEKGRPRSAPASHALHRQATWPIL